MKNRIILLTSLLAISTQVYAQQIAPASPPADYCHIIFKKLGYGRMDSKFYRAVKKSLKTKGYTIVDSDDINISALRMSYSIHNIITTDRFGYKTERKSEVIPMVNFFPKGSITHADHFSIEEFERQFPVCPANSSTQFNAPFDAPLDSES